MISIVLPTYNGEKFISESIDSILNQTFKDWELIIVDDCSTDNTAALVDSYAKKYDRIHVIHNKTNKKLPGALNVGFKLAMGDYLTWTSDDNRFYPDALETMKDYLDTNKEYAMVCTAYSKMDESGVEFAKANGYDEESMYFNDCVGACFLYRRQVYETIGGYDESVFCAEDYEYWLRVLMHCGKIGYIDDVHYAYRLHSGSLTVSKWVNVKKSLNEIRNRYFEIMFSRLSDNMDLLSGLYFDMIFTDSLTDEMKSRFCERIPQLDIIDENVGLNGPVIIYGAGEFGEKAYNLVKDNAVAYVDRDENKHGLTKNGLRILNIDELIRDYKDYNIVIAISSKYTYKVAMYLRNLGCNKIGSFQYLMRNQVRREATSQS